MNKYVLVVDDNMQNRKILSKILGSAGYMTLEAENGKVALDIVESQREKISLILLDIKMPVMDGYEFLCQMNKRELISFIPVIVVTGSDSESAEIKCLDCGASDYLTKPYNPDLVVYRVRSILRLFENAALLNRLEFDSLTGVYSKDFFYQQAEQIIGKNPDKKYEIVCLNIENFKLVNERYGTQVGDEVLKYVADCFAVFADETGVCGRIGADHFAVVREKKDYEITQQQFGDGLARKNENAPVKNLSMRFGIVDVTKSIKSASAMCDRGFLAAQSIKNKYGTYFAYYDDSLRQYMLGEQAIVDNMEEALAQKQFAVYLQPKHDVKTGMVAGAEALVRWIHPTMGFMSPGEFIPVFEKNGFITKLDYFVWEEVCKVLHKWQENGKRLVPVSVNVSRVDFINLNLTETMIDLVEKYDIPEEFLHLEITETAYTDNPQQIIATIEELRQLGFKIEMDDFGSGYSSLNMLSELPIDILKLDVRFIQQREKANIKKQSILSFVISLSKWLELPTVAEGVETADELELLKQIGCNYIQGYYFAKPMPVPKFEEYMDKNELNYQEEANRDNASSEFSGKKDERTVLVVEDIESNRNILDAIISPRYNIVFAENGEVAIDILNSKKHDISVILLDLMMPVMDGFTFLGLIKADENLKDIPVIITSELSRDSERRALHIGADSFVAKPYDPEILLHHIKKALEGSDLRRLLTGCHVDK